jgi:methyl-accepting chemotaxis protein WspA
VNLRTKFLLAAGAPMLVTTIAVSAFLLYVMYEARIRDIELYFDEVVANAAQQIDSANRQATDAAQILAIAQERGMFGDREESLALIDGIIEHFPHFTGVYVGYEPNADGQDLQVAQAETRQAGSDAEGRFIPYVFRALEDSGRIKLTELADMESSFYYQGLKNRQLGLDESAGVKIAGGISRLYEPPSRAQMKAAKYLVTEPYLYEGKFLVEQTSPIVIAGEFKGVAGVDRALNDIDGFLDELRTFTTESFLLVSARGRVISSTKHPELRGALIEDTPYAALLEGVYLAPADSRLFTAADPYNSQDNYYVSKHIPTGDWLLVTSVERAEILAPLWATLTQVVAIIGIGAVLALLVSIWAVSIPIKRIVAAARTSALIAEGDLTQQLDSGRKDEVGVLLGAMGAMVSSLSSMITKVKGFSVQLNSVSNEVKSAATRQHTISQDFAASTNEIAASITEINATSQELLATMQEVSEATASTADVANSGRDDLVKMEQTMNALSEATQLISSKLEVIAERANNIGAVVTTISKIADQTNLLSLNASIEAEKAGEQGLGFSVVAREIRRLADQTAIATLDIETIVRDMQSSVTSGVMEMDRFGERVRGGVREAMGLGEQLSSIIESVETLEPRFASAHSGMQAQVTGASQINQAMLQLRDIAGSAWDSSHVLSGSSEQLLEAIEALRSEVIRFKTV